MYLNKKLRFAYNVTLFQRQYKMASISLNILFCYENFSQIMFIYKRLCIKLYWGCVRKGLLKFAAKIITRWQLLYFLLQF